MRVNAYCRNPGKGLAQWELEAPTGGWDLPNLERALHLVTMEAEKNFGPSFRPPVLLSITTETVTGTLPAPTEPMRA